MAAEALASPGGEALLADTPHHRTKTDDSPRIQPRRVASLDCFELNEA